jgi:acetolactate decarboxylase
MPLDFGLGTFDNLDATVMLDGPICQIASDGRVNGIGEQAATPFACVILYKPLSHDELEHELTYEASFGMAHKPRLN